MREFMQMHPQLWAEDIGEECLAASCRIGLQGQPKAYSQTGKAVDWPVILLPTHLSFRVL